MISDLNTVVLRPTRSHRRRTRSLKRYKYLQHRGSHGNRADVQAARSSSLTWLLIQAIGKLELRKRNESFNKRSGTKTPTVSSSKDVDGVETVEDFDKKTVIPKWAVVTLCFCVFGGGEMGPPPRRWNVQELMKLNDHSRIRDDADDCDFYGAGCRDKVTHPTAAPGTGLQHVY